MEYLVIAVAAAIAIIAVTAWAPQVGTSAPLLLVLLGVGVSFLTDVPAIEIEPEWILAGVLPPLLYSTSVSLPVMDFRRDFTAISALSVTLVVVSSVVLGFLFTALIPGISLPVGIALGAVVSPTDAVATSIVRRVGVSGRLVTVLEGESLFNDASALVILRSAILATTVSVSLWDVLGDFVFAVTVAGAIGSAVGVVSLVVRHRLTDPSIATAISFVVPFVAYLPTEQLGASGLVATVVAGLISGMGGARYLNPEARLSETANWHTLEIFIEGAVFLVMGLELFGFIEEVQRTEHGVGTAVGIAVVAAGAILALRALFLWPLLWRLRRRRERLYASRERLSDLRRQLDDAGAPSADAVHTSPPRHHRSSRWRLARRIADVDYVMAERLGPREGTVLVWAGMRGAVTVAAAQTLPVGTAHRDLLILIAFFIAAGTLLVQGATLPWIVRVLGLVRSRTIDRQQREVLLGSLRDAAAQVLDDPLLRRADGSAYDPDVVARSHSTSEQERSEIGDQHDDGAGQRAHWWSQMYELRVVVLNAQRQALLDARRTGVVSSAALADALTVLDADQISIALRQRIGRNLGQREEQ